MKNNEVGSVAIHHCNKGYQGIGSPIRQCLLTGEWSGSMHICKRELKRIILMIWGGIEVIKS